MKKWFILVFLLIIGVYIACFTNLIFNHSCVGITYASKSAVLGDDLIVRYFENEREAEGLYKSENIDTYYLVAVKSDNHFGYKNTSEWFQGLQAPLVDEKVKYITAVITDDFVEENALMVYNKGSGVEDGYIDDSEWDNTYELFVVESAKLSLMDNCTKEEKEYCLKHRLFSSSLKSCFERYQISVKQNDAYSISYWSLQVIDLYNNWQPPAFPKSVESYVNWEERSSQFARYFSTISDFVEKLNHSQTLSESYINSVGTSVLAYYASAFSLENILITS